MFLSIIAGMTKHRKQLVFAKTTIFWREQVILAKLFIINTQKPHAMTKILQNTFTFQIWIQSDRKKIMIL